MNVLFLLLEIVVATLSFLWVYNHTKAQRDFPGGRLFLSLLVIFYIGTYRHGLASLTPDEHEATHLYMITGMIIAILYAVFTLYMTNRVLPKKC